VAAPRLLFKAGFGPKGLANLRHQFKKFCNKFTIFALMDEPSGQNAHSEQQKPWRLSEALWARSDARQKRA